jgi:hypothetical protein
MAECGALFPPCSATCSEIGFQLRLFYRHYSFQKEIVKCSEGTKICVGVPFMRLTVGRVRPTSPVAVDFCTFLFFSQLGCSATLASHLHLV